MFDVDFHILNQKATPAIYADTLANRPNFGFAGRIFINTASPYGVYRDTGSAWVQIASNGGGGGSTGVNGLNGTTNIGLGGTLTGFTQISGGTNDLRLNNYNTLTIEQTNNIDIKSFFSSSVIYGRLNITTSNTNLFFGDSTTNTLINLTSARIKTQYGNGEVGLDLNFSNGKYVLGDYGNDAKYNSFVVDDLNDRFYFTTSYNQANTDQDLFYVSNNPSARFVKLGDFNSYTNDTYLIIDDTANTLITSGINGIAGLNFDFSNELYELGANNAKVICDNSNDEIDITALNIVLSTTPAILTATITNTATASIPSNYLSIQINGNNYKILLLNP